MKVLVVDDHTMFRQSLVALLREDADMRVVDEAASAEEALDKARRLLPDVVVMDVRLPGMSGLEATRIMHRDLPATAVLVLTVCDRDDDLFEAVKSGARGYMLKNASIDDLRAAIRALACGQAYISPAVAPRLLDAIARLEAGASAAADRLTARERETVRLVAQGKSNAEIAQELYISPHTVKIHVRNALRKLGLHNRAQLAAYAVEEGFAGRH